ncbi:MAG: FAD-dependent thymidylate synthase [Sarcina sp.]
MIKVMYATPNPIQLMGSVSGCCYGSNIERSDLNYKRGLKCLQDGHGRVLEYPDVIMEIDGYSARCVRELYTHIQGTSRLQSSTRYINYEDFSYYTPDCLDESAVYHEAMMDIISSYEKLVGAGYPKEHVANLLPLGMISKMVIKINYRALLHLAELRLCARAYVEIQDMTKEIIEVIGRIDSEWKELMTYMKPKCSTCQEKHNCPRLNK